MTQTRTLHALSQAGSLFAPVQTELNTGKKVNSAADDAVAYFRSAALYDRAGQLLGRKADVDQSIQSLQAALSATTAVDSLLQQLRGVLGAARGAPLSNRVSATVQFKAIGLQLAQLVKDASYQGLSLLTGTGASLTAQFSERTAAALRIDGFDLVSTSAGNARSLFTGTAIAFGPTGAINFSSIVAASGGGVAGFSQLGLATSGATPASQAAAIFTASDNRIRAAINQNQAVAAVLGTNLAILQARSNFSDVYAGTLSAGGDKLTLADLDAEAANAQALQLRQQIGIAALTGPGPQGPAILQLLRPG